MQKHSNRTSVTSMWHVMLWSLCPFFNSLFITFFFTTAVQSRVCFVFLPNSTLNLDLWSQHLVPLPSSRRFSNHASFQEILNELNDYAGQRELIAENLITGICVDLLKKLQDFKQERKMVREGGSECEREIGRGRKRKEELTGKFGRLKTDLYTLPSSSWTAWHLLHPLPSSAPGWCQEGPAEFREQL